jgi:YgiT-type zinc finger domain-containing protein
MEAENQNKGIIMDCKTCKQGTMELGEAPVARQNGEAAVLVLGVPAHICPNCSEHHLEDSVAARIKEIVKENFRPKAKVIVVNYTV